ncbi:MAG: aspartate-semialdehyde dehydrogenase [Tissierella sp.]|uniref:aspartate-semialdehyde dehydrogenase n=1 Tax=Tissierella sp. TaxID=41274 RepID=UPI003F948D16
MKKYNLAVLGATGLVGSTMVKILEERKFPVENIYFLASKRSAGDKIKFQDKDYIVEELKEESFDKDIDIALFAAGGAITEKYGKLAASKGIKVIDNSSLYRMDKDTPLIVPEVNINDIKDDNKIIANPNCTTIQAVVALKPLHDKFNIKRIVYSTYQAVSGSGVGGIKDLEEERVETYPYPISFNALPHVDSFLENGYTKEEIKMIDETKKIFGDPSIKVTATCVRVPVKYAHSLSINVEFEDSFKIEEIRKELEDASGVIVKDDGENNIYPMAIDIEGKDSVYVGRIRRDFSLENGINLWVVADNVRKGAALNAVQIAEAIINKK